MIFQTINVSIDKQHNKKITQSKANLSQFFFYNNNNKINSNLTTKSDLKLKINNYIFFIKNNCLIHQSISLCKHQNAFVK